MKGNNFGQKFLDGTIEPCLSKNDMKKDVFFYISHTKMDQLKKSSVNSFIVCIIPNYRWHISYLYEIHQNQKNQKCMEFSISEGVEKIGMENVCNLTQIFPEFTIV